MNRLRIQAFCYQWPGTQSNHAGMAYFAQCLKRDLGFPFACFYNSSKKKWQNALAKHYAKFTLPWTDCFFLMEYLTPLKTASQEQLALRLRKKGVRKPLIGLAHLPEQLLLKYWKLEDIRSAMDSLDYVIVYGSSLAKFFERIGYGHKVRQTFHYVDADYYHPVKEKEKNENEFKIICVGSLLRDVGVLKEITQQCPHITFEVCAGIADLIPVLGELPNVLLYDYLPEDELLCKIQQADASLSVMKDTIGSNAIVAGLACGLPQIVSDVGSIRDYCSEENSIFCKDTGDFVKALQSLSQNKSLCLSMGNSARKRAEELSLSKSIDWFRDFFTTLNKRN